VYDLATRTPIRLTTTGNALHPTWTPDGQRIVFAASAPAPRGLRSQRADGSAPAEAVRGAEGGIAPMVASDGKTVVFQRLSVRNGWDLWSASPNGTDAPRKLVNDQAAHYMPAVSPDGHWIADVSTATGQNEVYVRPYPGSGPAVQVSDRGGAEPAWSPDGHRLYYRTRDAFMVAAVSTHPAFTITSRRQLFKDTFDGAMPHRNYDVLPDGSGFLMLTGGSSETLVVINWLTELRARLAHVR
jgi:Tol biopolymer transport system component